MPDVGDESPVRTAREAWVFCPPPRYLISSHRTHPRHSLGRAGWLGPSFTVMVTADRPLRVPRPWDAAENASVCSARPASIHLLAIEVAASARPARERRKPGAGEMVLGPTKGTPPRGTSPGANSVKLRHPPCGWH